MTASWFQGPATEFIEASRRLFDQGGNILHLLGGWTCDISGDRAISQVKMTINQRAPVEGVLVDVVCFGRFYDFLEKRDGCWASSAASRSMKRTGWTQSIPRRFFIWTRTCFPVSRKGIATLPISNQGTA